MTLHQQAGTVKPCLAKAPLHTGKIKCKTPDESDEPDALVCLSWRYVLLTRRRVRRVEIQAGFRRDTQNSFG
jgi:hypothetical protein